MASEQNPLINKENLPNSSYPQESINCFREDDINITTNSSFFARFIFELILSLYIFSIVISSTLTTQLFIEETCIESYPENKTQCEELNKHENLEKLTQLKAAWMIMANSISSSIIPAIISFFLGTYGDIYGRKKIISLSLLGASLTFLTYSLLSLHKNIHLGYYIAAGIPYSVTGGGLALLSNCFSFVTEIYQPESRTKKYLLLELILALGAFLGNISIVYIYSSLGYAGTYNICTVVCFCSFLISLLIEEKIPSRQTANDNNRVFNMSLLKEMFFCCFKKRPNHQRSILLLSLSQGLLIFLVYEGHSNLMFLFTRMKFSWTLSDISRYNSISIIILIIGTFIILGISKIYQINELYLNCFTFLTIILGCIINAIALQPWWLYLSLAITLFRGINSAICRNIMTKCISSDELGKVFTFYASLQSFLPFIASSLYTVIYDLTVKSFPGAFFIFSSIIYGIVLFFQM